jgi:hypothetical protein
VTDLTPNLKLALIKANRKTWADVANQNSILIDAAIGSYFAIQNLQGIWENSRAYEVGQTVVDGETAAVWTCQVDHISAGIPTTFSEDRAANSTFWTVYSSPARARGIWEPNTSYAVNDFVVNGPQYAVCIATHLSSANFAADVATGYWSILIDVSGAGDAVLPNPGGAGDANKFAITNPSGTGYTIADVANVLTLLGTTAIGQALLQANSMAAARSAIDAQVAGSYQASNANLTTLSSATLNPFGVTLLALATAAQLRTSAELGTAATRNTGTVENTIPLLGSGGKLAESMIPLIDLTDMVSGVLPAVNGGNVPARGYTAKNATGYSLSSSYSDPMTISEGIELFSHTYTAANGKTVFIAVDVMNCIGQNQSMALSAFLNSGPNAAETSIIRFTNVASHQQVNRVMLSYVSDGNPVDIDIRAAGTCAIGSAVLLITEFEA